MLAAYKDIVLVRGIPFHSHCEHHMLPFIGEAHIAYYPAEGVVGLSKLARVVDIYAKRLQTQENLTAQIASVIDDALAPRGLAVMLEAEHQCMTMPRCPETRCFHDHHPVYWRIPGRSRRTGEIHVSGTRQGSLTFQPLRYQ